MREEHSAESVCRSVGKAREERTEHCDSPCIVVDRLTEEPQAKTVSKQMEDVGMAERVDERPQDRAVPYIPHLRECKVYNNNKKNYEIIRAIHT